MKKTILMIILFITTISGSLMAKSGWGVDLSVPLGAGIGFYLEEGKQSEIIKPDAGFEFGVYLKPNYYFDLSILSLGISLDLGYQRDVFAFKSDLNKGNLTFDSLSLGLMPKIDILFMSIGVGAGVKFPLGGSSYSKENSGGEQRYSYNLKELQNQFYNLYIPYLKASIDFLLLYNITLGVYLSYDFPLMEYKDSIPKVSFGGLDVGGQIGIRF
ncbi:outer membrane beta-barrel protein [Brachyspira alvinipulli]|uniref:outer membrane beta-barrel protein n=1 Tax=Brachyspira alvinipulli TaxID=84379 RepID=UPI0004827377|nr:outer membrane beta-barrel protein [Brachyspira alvinipulli]